MRIYRNLHLHHPGEWSLAPRGYLNHANYNEVHGTVWTPITPAVNSGGYMSTGWGGHVRGGGESSPPAGCSAASSLSLCCSLRDQRSTSLYQMPLPVFQAPRRGRVDGAEEQGFLGAC